MAIASYRIGTNVLSDEDSNFDTILEKAHTQKTRPLCLCTEQPIEMYIARCADRHIIKRMPGTGINHDPSCEHFEPPASLSGLGDVMDRAIKPQADDTMLLKLDFSLSKTGKTAAAKAEGKSDTVKSQGSKLTLLSFMHYLWHDADLNRWQPHWNARRNWSFVRDKLTDAVLNKQAKSAPLADRLYMPEPYNPDTIGQIRNRRKQFIAPYLPKQGTQKTDLILYLAEIKSIEAARWGSQLVIKNARDFPLFLDDKTLNSLRKRFETEFALWQANEAFHLIICATATLSSAGSATLEEAAIMVCNEKWIPVEHLSEAELIASLIDQRRPFIKGLRFNVKDRPIASVLLTDTKPHTAMFIIAPDMDIDHANLQEIANSDQTELWAWFTATDDCPAIPISTSS